MSKKWEKEASIESKATMQDSRPEEEKVEFDSWWAARSSMIPAIHLKEIIKADFKGRTLSDLESMEAFDMALEKYGIKLG